MTAPDTDSPTSGDDDSRPLSLYYTIFTAEYSDSLLGVPWSEGQKLFRPFSGIPVKWGSDEGPTIGFTDDELIDSQKGISARINIYSPDLNTEQADSLRSIRRIMLGSAVVPVLVAVSDETKKHSCLSVHLKI